MTFDISTQCLIAVRLKKRVRRKIEAYPWAKFARSGWQVGGLEHVWFFHVLGMSSSQVTFMIFQRGGSTTSQMIFGPQNVMILKSLSEVDKGVGWMSQSRRSRTKKRLKLKKRRPQYQGMVAWGYGFVDNMRVMNISIPGFSRYRFRYIYSSMGL